MNGFRFYADLPSAKLSKRTTVKQLKEYAGHINVVALLLGDEHRVSTGSQEALVATFDHPDSDTSLSGVGFDYLRECKRIPESLARKLHPRLFARLDANEG